MFPSNEKRQRLKSRQLNDDDADDDDDEEEDDLEVGLDEEDFLLFLLKKFTENNLCPALRLPLPRPA